MKKITKPLKILFKIFIIIEILIAIDSVIIGVFYIRYFGLDVFVLIIGIFMIINNAIYEKLNQTMNLAYNSLLHFPIAYFQIFVIIFFIILFFKLRKRFNNKIAFTYSIIPMIIIFALCSYFLRTIPDYSSKTHKKIVTLKDYKKYQQGYCLEEDRILPKDELYKRVAINHFIKKKESQKIFFKRLYGKAGEYGYYIFKDIELDNYKDYLRNKAYSSIYTYIKEIKSINYNDYLIVDTKNNTAGFTKPIVFVKNIYGLIIAFYADIAFDFKDNTYGIYELNLLDNFNENKDKEEYKNKFKVFDLKFMQYEANKKKRYTTYKYKFDNCGYSNLNPEKEAKESLEEINFK